MIIRRVKFKNFRCFGSAETTLVLNDLSVLIGANSAGKTATILGLLRLFGPSQKDRSIIRSDFHVPIGASPDHMSSASLCIEAVIEFPELLTTSCMPMSDGVPIFFSHMLVNNQGETPYVRVRLDASWKPSNSPDGEIEQNLHYVLVPEGQEEVEGSLQRVPATDRASIQVMYVPAIRNPSEQLRHVSGTILWRVIRGIRWPEGMDERLKEKMRQVDTLFDEIPGLRTIRDVMKQQWQIYHKDRRYRNTDVAVTSSDLESLLKRIEVNFEPTETTHKYTVDQLGDGLRSIFYLTLVSTLLEIEEIASTQSIEDQTGLEMIRPVLTLLAVEEPENHVAPHLLGRIIKNLLAISLKINAQVVMSTHTPALVKRVDPQSLIHLRYQADVGCTTASAIPLPEKTDEAYKYIKNAIQTYPELYFSRLVVLAEGESEELLLPRLVQLLGTTLDASDISVVPLGGRHVNHLWKLLTRLSIPYFTLLDLDRERHGGGWGRIKYVLNQLIEAGGSREHCLTVGAGASQKQLLPSAIESIGDRSDTEVENMNTWINYLQRTHGVFFSYPLDLDFMMLEHFLEYYKATAVRGPQFLGDSDPETREQKVIDAVWATLKKGGGTGDTYSDAQKELMVWYNYLFLYRGKPSTHLLALSNMSDEELQQRLPVPLKTLIESIERHLSTGEGM